MDRRDDQTPQGLITYYFLPPFVCLIISCPNNFSLSLSPSLSGETARILAEFFEVAINSIVFLKGFYPSGTLRSRLILETSFVISDVTLVLLSKFRKSIEARTNL